MTTPAERYAASRRRQADRATALGRFASGYDFTFDAFQVRACEAVGRLRSPAGVDPDPAGRDGAVR